MNNRLVNKYYRSKKLAECVTCGKKFYPITQALKKGMGKYCSRKCQLNKKGRIRQGKYWAILTNQGKYIKYTLEHRLIMEKMIGRKLKSKELVHHINGNGLDNNINNLKIITRDKHLQLHHADIIKNIDYEKSARKRAKFTDTEILEIKRKHQNGISLNKLHKEYKTSKFTIWKIINNKSYFWLLRKK